MAGSRSYRLSVLLVWCILEACSSHVQQGSSLDTATLHRIHSLFHIPDSEQVLQFYTPYKGDVGGNFITARRIGIYWVHEDDTMKKDTAEAYYSGITRIDTVADAGFTRAPYLRVVRRDSAAFKVYIAGTKQEVTNFFRTAIAAWVTCKADSSEYEEDED